MMKLPGYIQVNYAPDGEAGSGGAPAGGGGTSATPSSAPEPSSAASSTPSSPSGAAASTPSPQNDSPPTAPQPLSGEFDGFSFDTEDDDFSPTPAAPAAAVPPEQPQQPPPVQQAPDPAATATPQQPTGQEQQTGPQGQQPQFPTHAEPAKIGAALLSNIDTLADQLAGTPEFKLSEEEIEAINTDVTTAIPRLMARMHVRAQAAALSQMEQVIPAIMQRFMTAERARAQSENAFYSRWPDLNPGAHGNLVNRFAATYRRMNPSATKEQMIEEIGPMVMMAAKVAPSMTRLSNGGVAPGTQVQNGAPARRLPPPSPFQPAVGGSAAPPTASTPDPWEGFGLPSPDEE